MAACRNGGLTVAVAVTMVTDRVTINGRMS